MSYDPKITVKKGGTHFLNIISSTAFSGFLVILFREVSDEEFQIENIRDGINNIAGSIIFLTPFVSAIIRMIANFIKRSKKGGRI